MLQQRRQKAVLLQLLLLPKDRQAPSKPVPMKQCLLHLLQQRRQEVTPPLLWPSTPSRGALPSRPGLPLLALPLHRTKMALQALQGLLQAVSPESLPPQPELQ